MWLAEATVQDIALVVMEENEYLAFKENRGKVVSKGPTALQKKMKERKVMRAYTEAAMEAILHGDIMQEAQNYDVEAANFMPTKLAKHPVPKVFSTKNPVEKDIRPKNKGSHASSEQKNKKRARSPIVETDFEEQSQASKAEEIAPIVIDDEGVNGNQGDDEAEDVVEAVSAVVKLMPAPVT